MPDAVRQLTHPVYSHKRRRPHDGRSGLIEASVVSVTGAHDPTR